MLFFYYFYFVCTFKIRNSLIYIIFYEEYVFMMPDGLASWPERCTRMSIFVLMIYVRYLRGSRRDTSVRPRPGWVNNETHLVLHLFLCLGKMFNLFCINILISKNICLAPPGCEG